MKKGLRMTALFLLAFIIFTASACADTAEIIDKLGSLTLEELMEVQNAIKAEITARPENTFTVLAPGFYTVGETVLPGEYYFLFDKSQNGSSEADIYIYRNQEDFEKGYEAYSKSRVLYDADLYQGGDSIRFTLADGNIIAIEDSSVKISVADFSEEIKQLAVIPEKATEVPLGYYVAGTDIQVGKLTAYVPVGGRSTIRIYDNVEKYSANDYDQYYYLGNGNWNATFELAEGQVLEIKEYSVYISKAESKMLTFD